MRLKFRTRFYDDRRGDRSKIYFIAGRYRGDTNLVTPSLIATATDTNQVTRSLVAAATDTNSGVTDSHDTHPITRSRRRPLIDDVLLGWLLVWIRFIRM